MPAVRGENKIAILLTSLPRPAAESVLARLGPERESRMRALMDQVRTEFSPDIVENVLGELEETLLHGPQNLPARPRLAGNTSADADEYLPSVAGRPSHRSAETTGIALHEPLRDLPEGDAAIAELRGLGSDRLVVALEGEHPRGVATVLSCLDAPQACETLMRLPPEIRKEVFSRLGQTAAGTGDVSMRIIQAVVAKSRAAAEVSTESSDDDKAQKMADILKTMERSERLNLLGALAERDEGLAAAVRDRLYVFEDLAQIKPQSMQKLLAEIDPKTLAAALQNAAEDIVENVMSNMSKRARESLTEEMSFLDGTTAAQIQQARKSIVDVVQQMDQTGELG
jgi:flagellar motor switch protein FliG